MVASPRRWRDWLKIIGRLITRRQPKEDPVEILPAQGVSIRIVRSAENFQLDGDVEGDFLSMEAEIAPGP